MHVSSMPDMDYFREIYVNTCQFSCHVIENNLEGDNCREKFCPVYVKYLLDGYYNVPDTHILVSEDNQAVNQFCAGWILELMRELGWNHRIHVQLKECRCAASKSCRI